MGPHPRRRYEYLPTLSNFYSLLSILGLGFNIVGIVTLTEKARRVTVKGKRGEITKSFRHMPVEMQIKKQNTRKRKGQYLCIRMWFAGKKQACSVSTLKSLIRNMITGVTQVRRLLLKIKNTA